MPVGSQTRLPLAASAVLCAQCCAAALVPERADTQAVLITSVDLAPHCWVTLAARHFVACGDATQCTWHHWPHSLPWLQTVLCAFPRKANGCAQWDRPLHLVISPFAEDFPTGGRYDCRSGSLLSASVRPQPSRPPVEAPGKAHTPYTVLFLRSRPCLARR